MKEVQQNVVKHLGVACEKILLPGDVSQEELLAAIDKVNKDDADSWRSSVPSASETSGSVCDRECTWIRQKTLTV